MTPGKRADASRASLTARTLGALRWALLAAAGEALLSLAIVMALSRLLAPSDFGLLAIALVFLALGDAAGRGCIGPAIVQRGALGARYEASGFVLSVGMGAAFAALLCGLAPWVAPWLAEPGAAPVLRALSFACVLTGAGTVSDPVTRTAAVCASRSSSSCVASRLVEGVAALVL